MASIPSSVFKGLVFSQTPLLRMTSNFTNFTRLERLIPHYMNTMSKAIEPPLQKLRETMTQNLFSIGRSVSVTILRRLVPEVCLYYGIHVTKNSSVQKIIQSLVTEVELSKARSTSPDEVDTAARSCVDRLTNEWERYVSFCKDKTRHKREEWDTYQKVGRSNYDLLDQVTFVTLFYNSVWNETSIESRINLSLPVLGFDSDFPDSTLNMIDFTETKTASLLIRPDAQFKTYIGAFLQERCMVVWERLVCLEYWIGSYLSWKWSVPDAWDLLREGDNNGRKGLNHLHGLMTAYAQRFKEEKTVSVVTRETKEFHMAVIRGLQALIKNLNVIKTVYLVEKTSNAAISSSSSSIDDGADVLYQNKRECANQINEAIESLMLYPKAFDSSNLSKFRRRQEETNAHNLVKFSKALDSMHPLHCWLHEELQEWRSEVRRETDVINELTTVLQWKTDPQRLLHRLVGSDTGEESNKLKDQIGRAIDTLRMNWSKYRQIPMTDLQNRLEDPNSSITLAHLETAQRKNVEVSLACLKTSICDELQQALSGTERNDDQKRQIDDDGTVGVYIDQLITRITKISKRWGDVDFWKKLDNTNKLLNNYVEGCKTRLMMACTDHKSNHAACIAFTKHWVDVLSEKTFATWFGPFGKTGGLKDDVDTFHDQITSQYKKVVEGGGYFYLQHEKKSESLADPTQRFETYLRDIGVDKIDQTITTFQPFDALGIAMIDHQTCALPSEQFIDTFLKVFKPFAEGQHKGLHVLSIMLPSEFHTQTGKGVSDYTYSKFKDVYQIHSNEIIKKNGTGDVISLNILVYEWCRRLLLFLNDMYEHASADPIVTTATVSADDSSPSSSMATTSTAASSIVPSVSTQPNLNKTACLIELQMTIVAVHTIIEGIPKT